MQTFNQLISFQAEKIEQIFISDLHLSLIEPVSNDLEQAFLALLDNCLQLPKLMDLFILGDWFEAWLGDDVAEMADTQIRLAPMLEKLTSLQQKNCQVWVMVGNRDFLLGKNFCDKFGGKLIQAPFYLHLDYQTIRLEHGDALCTDDKQYQRFRNVIQNPFSKKLLLALPLHQREKIAHNLRQKSRRNTAIKAQQSMTIMDVNATAVTAALRHCDILLHGHTHRPAIHHYGDKQRIVLGDWRVQDKTVIAEIGVIVADKLILATFRSD